VSNKGRGRRHVGDVSIPSPWSGGVGASVPSGSIGCIRSGARPSKLHRPADELIYRSNFLRCLGDLRSSAGSTSSTLASFSSIFKLA